MKTPKMLTMLTITAVTVATLATASVAQEHSGSMFAFATVDTHRDGKVTKAELAAHFAAKTALINVNADTWTHCCAPHEMMVLCRPVR